MEEWGNMSQVFIGNGRARLPERLDDSGNLERVPYQDGVGYQAQAARLVHDLLVVPGAEFWRALCCISAFETPPSAVPKLTPIRSCGLSAEHSKPLSARASLTEATAN